MKRLAASFAVLALTAAGVVAAQTSSSTPPPSSNYPSNSSSSQSSSSPSSSYSSSASGKSHEQMMKDCMTQEQANNPNMSKSDMKKACKAQMHSSGGSSPHE
jgi:hypothetical protein